MSINRAYLLILLIISISYQARSQKGSGELGKNVNTPKINNNPKKNNPTPPKKNNPPQKEDEEFEDIFEDSPKLPFTSEQSKPKNNMEDFLSSKDVPSGIKIEPIRSISENVHDDTSSIDDGELLVIEVEDFARFEGSENFVQVAPYFVVWDTRNLDPYHIDPKSFNQSIPIKLYNDEEGRKWAPMVGQSSLTSAFKWRGGRWHKGVDLDLQTGDPVYAAFDGVIRIAGTQNGYGRTVLIRHYNGLETLYGHLNSINFDVNTIVKAGEEIGKGGNTGRSFGSHLHFETRYEGNQFDPSHIYNFKNNPMEIRSTEFLLEPSIFGWATGRVSKPYNVSKETPTSESVSDLKFSPDEGSEVEYIDDEEEELPVEMERKIWYTVRAKDTLYEISRNFNVSVAKLCELNLINSSKKLVVGQRLRIK
ncbi:MAG: peptidoglycan DD-metalloendopeptidase family protein [Leadbetterella sp.]